MGKMNILDPITPPQSDDFFYLIVDPYKSRFFFFKFASYMKLLFIKSFVYIKFEKERPFLQSLLYI